MLKSFPLLKKDGSEWIPALVVKADLLEIMARNLGPEFFQIKETIAESIVEARAQAKRQNESMWADEGKTVIDVKL